MPAQRKNQATIARRGARPLAATPAESEGQPANQAFAHRRRLIPSFYGHGIAFAL